MSEIREDKKILQEYLQGIAFTLANSLPHGWSKVIVGYFIENTDVSHQQIFFLKPGNDDYVDLMNVSWDDEKYDDTILEVRENCKQLHNLCLQSGDNWNSMTLTLLADGFFNVDYCYNLIDNYDARYVMEWQSQYLD